MQLNPAPFPIATYKASGTKPDVVIPQVSIRHLSMLDSDTPWRISVDIWLPGFVLLTHWIDIPQTVAKEEVEAELIRLSLHHVRSLGYPACNIDMSLMFPDATETLKLLAGRTL